MASKRNTFKQKVIIFFGYNGSKYHGLQHQKNSEVETVEAKLYQSLFDSNLIGKASFGELHHSGWSRGARTDKGVHALCNAIAVKLCISREFLINDFEIDTQQEKQQIEVNVEKQVDQEEQKEEQKDAPLQQKNFNKKRDKFRIDFKKIINLVNSNLPQDVRAFTAKLVTNNFDVRKYARCRFYEYIAPLCVYLTDNEKPSKDQIDSIFERVKGVIAKFKGSHNFHNYSRGIQPKDPSAQRYIMDIFVEKIEYENEIFFKQTRQLTNGYQVHFIRIKFCLSLNQENDGNGDIIILRIVAWYKLELFPINIQIDSFIENTFFLNQLRIMLAPAQGLFLNRIDFEGYNRRLDIPESLDFTGEEKARVKEFRPFIVNHIYNQEIQHHVFSTWLKEMKEKEFNQEESEAASIQEE